MKFFSPLITGSLLLYACALGADQTSSGTANPPPDPTLPQPTTYHIATRSQNTRVWQRETYGKLPDGRIITQHHSFTELAAGLHYQDATTGQWLDSQEIIESFPGGAIARQGPTKVIFANNLNTAGAIDVQTGGKRLRSNILGLAYYDPATGDTALIAQIQDSTGELVATNQVLFSDAFSGVKADVRYTYKKASLEQDVILREQLATPESFGLSSDSELEVLTEFIGSPQEAIKEHAGTASPDSDQDISWGTTRLGHGKAFDLGAENDLHAKVSVKRHYATINGRKILLEIVPLNNIQASLLKLPAHAAIKSRLKTASKKLLLPRAPLAKATTTPMRLATAAPSAQGYVLDYVEINADQGDYVFRADTTYFISGYNNYDSVKLEGGTVLKYAFDAAIDNYGPITCQTGPYCPAVLTAVDDDSVGEPISGSTGTPSGCYAAFAIGQESDGGYYRYLRIAYASFGLLLTSSNVVSDCQFINDGSALACYDDSLMQVQNSLFWQDIVVFNDSYGGFSVGAANLTVHDGDTLLGSSVTLSLTNSLLVSVTNWGAPFTSVVCATNTDADGVFQIAGAASHYLATNSIYRNAGITNVGPDLLADLATKTTYPPIIYSNTPIAGGTYSPVVQRNSGIPDLGYHYDPLDYCLGRADASSNIVFTAGTAVGCFDLHATGGEPYNSYGLGLSDAMSVTYLGTLTASCAQVRYSTVQEGNGNWTQVSPSSFEGVIGDVAGIGSASYDPSIAATINARFTLFASHAYQPGVGNDYSSDLICRFTDCVINSDRAASYNIDLCFTNCLLLGTALNSVCSGSVSACIYLQNCTMREGSFAASRGGATWPIKIQNSAFESVDFSDLAGKSDMTDPSLNYCDYNAWITGQDRFPLTGTHELTISTFNWQTSWLGNFYLPPASPLIDAGNTTADQWGLYHFTTQTNQVKETNSIVDIGYHEVATDAYGNPDDTDGDGIPDYLEDSNGNGTFDVGDLGDWLVSLYNGLSRASGLIVFTPLK